MTTRPSKVPTWATTGSRVEPSDGRKETGWLVEDKPPAQYLNWMQGLNGEWLEFFRETTIPQSISGSMRVLTDINANIVDASLEVLTITYLEPVDKWFMLLGDGSQDMYVSTSEDGLAWETPVAVAGVTVSTSPMGSVTEFVTDGVHVAVAGAAAKIAIATTPWDAADFADASFTSDDMAQIYAMHYSTISERWIIVGQSTSNGDSWNANCFESFGTPTILGQDLFGDTSDGGEFQRTQIVEMDNGDLFVATQYTNTTYGSEIYKSTDAGETWAVVNTGTFFIDVGSNDQQILQMIKHPSENKCLIIRLHATQPLLVFQDSPDLDDDKIMLLPNQPTSVGVSNRWQQGVWVSNFIMVPGHTAGTPTATAYFLRPLFADTFDYTTHIYQTHTNLLPGNGAVDLVMGKSASRIVMSIGSVAVLAMDY